jgi:MFS family permease
LGVAKCLKIGFVLSFISRVIILTTTSEGVLLLCLLGTLPLSNCLGIPVLTVGIRRYTNEENRGFAFGLFYVVMNIGALIAGPLIDALTIHYNDIMQYSDGSATVASSSSTWVMTSNRAIILSGVVANFIAMFVAFSVREIKVDADAQSGTTLGKQNLPLVASNDEGDEYFPSMAGSSSSSSNVKSKTNVSSYTPVKGSPYKILSETIREPNFRRFLLVCLLTINVRMVFRHL